MARKLKASSKFGAELDSLSDFVSFGVAPAVLMYQWCLNGIPHWGWIFTLMFSAGMAMRLARSQFSANFFACAGYKIIDNLGFETVEAGVEAAVKAGAEVVVLCSSDDESATCAREAFKPCAGDFEGIQR